jgi:hypothetical protein
MSDTAIREAYMLNFIDAARPIFEAEGFPIPYNLRASISLPSTGINTRGTKQIRAQCFHPDASADGHWEIMVNPMTELDRVTIATVLTHELVHAAVGLECDHKGNFAKLAKAVGLTGKMTEANPSDIWFAWAQPILEQLGDIDFAQMVVTAPPRKKSKTYLRNAKCNCCNWTAQVTLSHVRPYDFLNCPTPDCDGTLVITYLEGDAEYEGDDMGDGDE